MRRFVTNCIECRRSVRDPKGGKIPINALKGGQSRPVPNGDTHVLFRPVLQASKYECPQYFFGGEGWLGCVKIWPNCERSAGGVLELPSALCCNVGQPGGVDSSGDCQLTAREVLSRGGKTPSCKVRIVMKKLIDPCWALSLGLLVLSVLGLAGCGGGEGGGAGGAAARMKLQGSGASFPAPLYLKWFKDYQTQNDQILVDYQAKGSGAGIQDLINGTVDFAASDAPLTEEEAGKIEKGAMMLPLTAGKVVLTYNVPGAPEQLKLSREAYTKIFMGEVTKWNDPVIAACNEGVTLPDLAITVVVRSDSSGTTYVFSNHLSSISESWKSQLGVNKTINWPNVSHIVKAPKNDGVTAMVKQTPGAIGYVEYGFAVQTGQPMAVLENQAGKYVPATASSGQAGLAGAGEVPEDLAVSIPDPAGDEAYPIVTYTWLLCYRQYDDEKKAQAIKDLVDYCLSEGQKSSESVGYIPLPESMVERVRAAVAQVQ